MTGEKPSVELRLRAAVEASPSGLLMVDAEGRIVLVNQEVERLFGYSREELHGKSVDLLVPKPSRGEHTQLRQGFLSNPQVRQMGVGRDLHGLRKDGTTFPVEIGLTPVMTDEGIFVVSSVVDISARKLAESERQKLEEQLRQAQKMEAVGTLAGGIAHDFNNILAAILGYGQLAKTAATDPEIQESLAEVLAAADRGKQLVRRVLSFSRHQTVERRPMALTSMIEEGLRLLRPALPASIEFAPDFDPDTPMVLADNTSVQQVLVNLGTNAAHAMEGAGRLQIGLSPYYIRDSMARSNGVREGPYALLSVRDSGNGIEAANLEHVLEPFFTTKDPGSGSGLGLTIVHKIMRDHEGLLQIESEVGRGTVVRCYFPAVTSEAETVSESTAAAPRSEGERVLYVDDEPTLAKLGKRLLEELGYRVEVCSDSTQALETFRADPRGFDAVITDYSMPRMDGVELATRITAIRPEIPLLLLTGYLKDFPPEQIRAAGVRRVASKPVSFTHLAEVLRSMLHTSAADDREGERPPEQRDAGQGPA